jgi:TetR/AcrR family transcriptional regulator
VGKSKSESRPDPSVRTRLLDAALDCFNRKGYAAATVQEIVEAAGVTKPTLYYYFSSKEGLYLELMESAFAPFAELLEQGARSEGSARERIEALCEAAFSYFRLRVAVARLMFAIYYGPPQGAPPFDFDRFHFAFQDRVRRLLVEGRKAGEFQFRRPDDAMWAIIGAMNIAMEVELCHPEMALRKKDLRRVLGLVFEGVSARGAAQARKGRKGVQP